MKWTRDKIIQRLKQLSRKKKPMSYNAMCRIDQSLVSASAYHFDSYRRAVEAAGIDYADVLRRPRWTKQSITRLIKQAHRKKEDLHWSAVTQRGDELGKAAFASLQPRLFGRWERALASAGLDADQIARYRKWNRSSIAAALSARAKKGGAMNSGTLQAEDPGLHAAAVRHFGNFDGALRAAKVNPTTVRRRRAWTDDEVIKSLRRLGRSGERMSDSAIRTKHPALYGASVRLFGSFTNARKAAGIKFNRSAAPTRKKTTVKK